ncbi:aminopeptidase P N-terminal domain-containing protein [Gracilimonas sp.]|uniref:aminopeptidase P N-terminal domain-containing protein n=1 Tax=Gracilimonas sp. TaxID=1974203 RepID=UPI003BAB9EE8
MSRIFQFALSIQSLLLLSLLFVFSSSLFAQQSDWNESTMKEDRPLFSEHFTPEEFSERRNKVYDAIGQDGIAILQGAPSPVGYLDFRQNNEFYYLSGIESPDAYLILNGQSREATIYLYNRKERREYGEGKILSFEDADLVKELSGIENVGSYSDLLNDLKSLNESTKISTAFTPHSPYEEVAMTRSMANRHIVDMKANPLDTRLSRHQNFIQEVREIAPDLKVKDLDPIIDELRKIKSEKELELIRRSTRLQAEVIMESMKSTEPGVKPYELEAVSKYIYWKHNIQDDAYYPLIHVGPDAYMNHYHNSERTAKAGDMILMDYGAYDRYYSSDLGRMWPVNGTFNPVQRELYSFYLKLYEAILYNIKLGLTPQQVMQNALKEIDVILEEHKFSKPLYQKAAEEFVAGYHERAENPNMRLGHGVGMSVHDVGDYAQPIEPGMVFVIEPQFRVPEERIYIRLEDMIIATENGVEIFSDFLPRDIESIEKLMQKEGLLQKNPISIDN